MPDVAFEYKRLFIGAKADAVFDAIPKRLATKATKVKPTLNFAVVRREDMEWN